MYTADWLIEDDESGKKRRGKGKKLKKESSLDDCKLRNEGTTKDSVNDPPEGSSKDKRKREKGCSTSSSHREVKPRSHRGSNKNRNSHNDHDETDHDYHDDDESDNDDNRDSRYGVFASGDRGDSEGGHGGGRGGGRKGPSPAPSSASSNRTSNGHRSGSDGNYSDRDSGSDSDADRRHLQISHSKVSSTSGSGSSRPPTGLGTALKSSLKPRDSRDREAGRDRGSVSHTRARKGPQGGSGQVGTATVLNYLKLTVSSE